MATLFQIRRGSGSVNTSIFDGELYLHKTSGSLQVSLGDSNPITLAKLGSVNSGSLSLSGDVSASNMFVSGNLTVSGNLFLGNNGSDNISVPGVFTTNLVPGTNGTLNLGADGARWNTIYANSVTASISGSVNNVNITALSESVNSQLVSVYQTTSSLNLFSASVTSSLEKIYESTSSLNNFSASVTASLEKLYESTASLNLFSASVTASLEKLYESTASLNLFSASVTASLENIYQTTASLEERATALATISGSLILTASNHEQRLGQIELKSSSYDGRFNDLATISSSLILTASANTISIENLNSYSASLKTAIELTGSSVTILGNLNVKGTQTVIDSTTIQLGDNIIELNGTSATNAGIIVTDPTLISLESGSLIYDTTENHWKAGTWSNESKILLAGGDNVFTSSLQLTEINSTTASLNQTTASLNLFSASVTASLEKIYESTASLNLFSASVTASLEKIYESTSSLNNFTASITGGINKIGYFNTEKSLTSYPNSYLGSQTFGLGTNATSSGAPERLMVDNSGENSYNIATFQTSKQDSYAQVNIKNFGSGSNASTDLILWNDVSTESSSYIDLGINSSNYSAGNVGYGGDGYLYNAANDLYVGSTATGSHGHLHLFAGNKWWESNISIYQDGTIGINTDKIDNNATTIPTPGYALEISGGVIFNNSIDVIGNISSSTISGMGGVSQFVTSIQSSTASLNLFSASVTASLEKLYQSTASLNVATESLQLFSSSTLSRLSALETETGSLEGRFTTLSQVTGSIHQFTSSLNTYTGATEIRLDDLEYTASISIGAGLAAEFTKINAYTASTNTRIDALELYSASYAQYFTYSGSQFHIDFNV